MHDESKDKETINPEDDNCSLEQTDPQLAEILDDEKPGSVAINLLLQYFERQRSVDPLQSPDKLKAYQEIDPELPKKLMDYAVREQQHRHCLEKQDLQAQISEMAFEGKTRKGKVIRGQVFAFIICLASLGAGVYLVANGHPVSGTIFGGTGVSLVALANVFLKDHSTAESDQDSKDLVPSDDGEEPEKAQK